MPIHDWSLVEAGIFHAFHTIWIAQISNALNGGVLPTGYYSLPEQHAGKSIADVLTLHASPDLPEPLPLLPATGGTAVAEAPPRARTRQKAGPISKVRRRSLAIRHVSEHRLVALLEIVSPANKDRPQSIADFVDKAASALERGVHLLVVDLFPPGRHDPHGLHGAIWERLDAEIEPYLIPDAEPLTLAAYSAGPAIESYVEHAAVGAALPEMPLFIRFDRYINAPLSSTYEAAFQGMPAFWRDVLEGRDPWANP